MTPRPRPAHALAPVPAPARTRRPARRPGRSAWRGFTLVEVLVALLIMAVIAAMGWQGVGAMARAREQTAQATERTLRLQSVIAQWEADLQAVYDTARQPGFAWDGAALRLVRRVDAGGVQVVVWSLREGVWRRWAGRPTTLQGELAQQIERAAQLTGAEQDQLVLLDQVSGVQLYVCQDRDCWTNPQSTGNLAEAPAAGASAPANRVQLPTGVRLQLDLPEGRLTRDVAMSPQWP